MAPGPWDPCAVAAIDKFTRTTKILWRKRDGMATRQVREGVRARESPQESPTPAWTGFYCFSGHITLRMILIYCAQVHFKQLQKAKEKVLLIT